MSKYGAFSGPYFSTFSPNTGKYGSEKTPHLDTFQAVQDDDQRRIHNPFNSLKRIVSS